MKAGWESKFLPWVPGVIVVFIGAFILGIVQQHPQPRTMFLAEAEFEGGQAAKDARADFCRKYLTPVDARAWRWNRCPEATGQ